MCVYAGAYIHTTSAERFFDKVCSGLFPFFSFTQVNVPMMSLPNLLRENFKESDFVVMKMDIEGLEYSIVRHLIMHGERIMHTTSTAHNKTHTPPHTYTLGL